MSEERKVEVGIVGLGRIATDFHIPSLRRIAGVHIRALCARTASAERLSLASGIGAHFFDSYEKMIASETLDAVYLCTPTVDHRLMAVAALRRGCHVFCEKPVALSVEEVAEMCSEARRNARLLVVGYNRRFSPTYRRLKRFSEENRINLLLLEKIRGTFVNTSKGDYSHRAAREARTLGPEVMEFGVHFVDLAKWIGGRVTRACFSGSRIPGVKVSRGNAVAILEHESGQRSILCFSLAGGRPAERSMAIGDRSTCETFGGMYGMSKVVITAGDHVQGYPSSHDVLEAGGFLQEDRDFITAIRQDRALPDGSEDAIDTLRLSLSWAGADQALPGSVGNAEDPWSGGGKAG
jgi:UDP-N-acetylglucosamine 3-dehydrogenase